MPAKCYFTTLGGRPLTFSGQKFNFEVCSFSAGRASGIFRTEDPTAITILDDAVRGKRGVREITEEEFAELTKKKAQTPSSSNTNDYAPRVVQPPILPQLAVESAPGVPAGRTPTGVTPNENLLTGPSATRPSIGNLLRMGKVNPPKPFAASDAKVKKASARADKAAKIRVSRPSDAG